ncbi:hypothetical protein PR048_014674 [Dryococelus australis]|uniref:Transposase n=1 Tax=Dryococelus australis TaxID=614101 RepID=A0ABQ9HF18_9NEOP|nr:hypothetical protein PR048_014674 [Dryococelus australis]
MGGNVQEVEYPKRKGVVVTDNGKNIVTAGKGTFGPNNHIFCFAHMLALVAKGTAFRVSTRWNSTDVMLQCFIDLSNVIGIRFCILCTLSTEKTPTACKVIHLLSLMRLVSNTLQLRFQTRNKKSQKKLKECVIASIEKRFGVIEKVAIFAMSTLLDHRFKRLHFWSPIATAQAVSCISKVIDEVVKASKTLQKCRYCIFKCSCRYRPDLNDLWFEHDSTVFNNPAEEENHLLMRYLQHFNSA